MQLWKLGCRWGGGTPLFYDFIKQQNIVIGWVDKDYAIGDWLFITDGHTVLSFAEVIQKRICILELPQYENIFKDLEIPFDRNIFIYKAKYIDLNEEDRFRYPLQQGIIRVQKSEYINKFNSLKEKYMNPNSNLIELLKSKKQIILQGAPGTGKTYLAKKIAKCFIDTNPLSDQDIVSFLKPGLIIPSVNGSTSYKIKDLENSKVVLEKQTGNEDTTTFEKIKDFYKRKQWGEDISNNDTRRCAALAKYLYDIQLKKQIKLVQFHPSYTYEDFVRGIVVETESGTIKYNSVNKILGKLADIALSNWKDSLKDPIVVSIESAYQKALDLFVEDMKEQLLEGGTYNLKGTTANIIEVTDKSFKYSFDSRPTIIYNLLFSDITKIGGHRLNIKRATDIKEIDHELEMKGKYPYYFRIFQDIEDFVIKNKLSLEGKIENIELKKYILIIDEINRANLPSVLGELIYALEYRGEKVESMYAVDGGDNELLLPPNLYIIGTMNTADRSVGQIDYAIRRRFAFIDVLPKSLTGEVDSFDEELFKKVSAFFIGNIEEYMANPNVALKKSEYLSDEFSPEDVWIGHSYFIMKEENRDMRLNYEIKPILREYLKDGILKENVNGENTKTVINSL